MADDLSLLFKIKGDATGAKQATAEARAAAAQLRSQFGQDLQELANVSKGALDEVGKHLNVFIGERLPIIGGSFVRVTENLRGLGAEGAKASPLLRKLSQSIQDISTATGKSNSEVTVFLKNFVNLEGQAARDAAALKFVGTAAATELIPQIDAAGKQMAELAVSGEAATSAFAGLAPPLILVGAVAAAQVAILYELTKQTLDLSEAFASFGGELRRASEITKLSVEQLNALKVVAEEQHVPFEAVVNTFGRYLKSIEEARQGNAQLQDSFIRLGIDIDKAASDPQDAINQLLAGIQKLGPTAAENANLARVTGGRTAQELIPLFRALGGSLDEATKKAKEFRDFTEEDAKQAEELEKQFADARIAIQGFTLELGKAAAPAVLDFLREMTQLLKENKETVELLSQAFKLFAEGNVRGILIPALQSTAEALGGIRDLWIAVKIAAALAAAQSIEAAEEIAKALKQTAPTTPTPTTPGAATTTGGLSIQAQTIARAQIEGLKELTAEQTRLTQDATAKAEIEYKRGEIDLEAHTAKVRAALAEENKVRQDSIAAQVAEQQRLAALRKDDVVEQDKIRKELAKLGQEGRDAQSETNRKIAELDQQEQEEINKRFIEHTNNLLDIRKKGDDAAIKLIEQRVKSGNLSELAGEAESERIINAELRARRTALEQELKLDGLNFDQRRQILQQLAALDQEQADTKKAQIQRTKELLQEQVIFERDLILKNLDDQLRIGQIRDNATIASIRALGDLRIKTEQETEEAITRVRLAAIDREISAIKARQTAAKTILDPKARKEVEQQLNNDLKAAEEERKGIEEQGERDSAAGFQRDLDRRRAYAQSIQELDDRIIEGDLAQRRAELETAAQRTGLNAKVIAAFRQLTLEEAAERHKRIDDEISAQEAEAHAVDVGGKNKLEIEQHYNQLREEENKRFHKQQEDINEPGGAVISGGPPPSAFNQLLTGLTEQFSGNKLTAVTAGVEALGTAFQSLGDAVGQAVEAYVLYGKAGASVRQVTAEILAAVARQAAIKAVFELAEGFAALALAFFGIPNAGPSASAHFAAAAIYGSIAGIAAVAGRGIAGNSFNQPTAKGGGSTSTGTPQALQSIQTGRNQPSQIIVVVKPDGTAFGNAVTAHVVQNIGDGGQIRDVIQNDRRG